MLETTPEQKMSNLLKLLGNPGECRGCKAGIWWTVTRAGKNMPINSDGTTHWATCPNVRDFKTKKQAERRAP